MRLGCQLADLLEIRQVHAGGQERCGVHQKAKAYHRELSVRMSHEFQKLTADQLGDPQRTNGTGTAIVKSVKGTIKKCCASVVGISG